MEVNPKLSENAKKDFKLVVAAQKGDSTAFAALLARYRDSIYYMLLKMVNNKIEAEDLTIEAFGKAFVNIHQYSPQYAFSTWLFRIASNNGVDFLRKKRMGFVSLDSTGDDKPDSDYNPNFRSSALNPEESIILSQRATLLRNIVSKLKPRYSRLVELRYFQEFSYEEIAKELNLPLGTVKVQLFRAREMLFNLIKESDLRKEE